MGTTYQSTVIAAPVDRVWDAIKNFHNTDWSPNVVTDLKVVGDQKGDEIGAKRVLNDAFHETLQTLDDAGRNFSYSIDDGPSPVSKDEVKNYIGQVSVKPITEGEGTFVEWSSSWDAGEGAADFCHGIYVALLGDMKASLE